jgi:hypothetical protein
MSVTNNDFFEFIVRNSWNNNKNNEEEEKLVRRGGEVNPMVILQSFTAKSSSSSSLTDNLYNNHYRDHHQNNHNKNNNISNNNYDTNHQIHSSHSGSPASCGSPRSPPPSPPSFLPTFNNNKRNRDNNNINTNNNNNNNNNVKISLFSSSSCSSDGFNGTVISAHRRNLTGRMHSGTENDNHSDFSSSFSLPQIPKKNRSVLSDPKVVRRRFLVTHSNGEEEIVDIVDELGKTRLQHSEMREMLESHGIRDIVSIQY